MGNALAPTVECVVAPQRRGITVSRKYVNEEVLMLKLSLTGGSPFARKVRIVLAEKGLEYEKDVGSASQRPAAIFSKQNPNLTVPVLVDGDTSLFESNLIIEYLLATYPHVDAHGIQPPLASRMTRPDHHWEDAKILAALEAMADIVVNMRFF